MRDAMKGCPTRRMRLTTYGWTEGISWSGGVGVNAVLGTLAEVSCPALKCVASVLISQTYTDIHANKPASQPYAGTASDVGADPVLFYPLRRP